VYEPRHALGLVRLELANLLWTYEQRSDQLEFTMDSEAIYFRRGWQVQRRGQELSEEKLKQKDIDQDTTKIVRTRCT
jgi:hypothetical protein